MAWESRGKSRFYYRARRVGGKVQKDYMGKGRKAHKAAAEDKAILRAKQQELAEIRAIEATLAPLAVLMRELDDGARMMMQGALLAANFHPHRGTWRMRRA